MKKFIFSALTLAAAVALAGCNTPQDRATGGALIGGAAGAAIGASATHNVGGAVAGGILGAATGAIIGGSTAEPRHRRCAHWGYDYYGDSVCTRYYYD
jgi:osmotically inducible lipoprotein OsmB